MKFLKRIIITCFVLGIFIGGGFAIYHYVLPAEVTENIRGTVSEVKDRLGLYEDSGITGETCEIDPEFYPYYSYLSDDCKKLYKQVYANAAALEKAFVPVVEVTESEVMNVVNAVYHDHPELFWMETGYSYKYTQDKICVHIKLEFNETADDMEASKKKFEEKADEIIQGAMTYKTDYEKEWYVYRAIVEHTEYNDKAKLHQSPYSALVYGESVCAGYARAFQYIMIKLGVPTYYCTGEVAGHAWNIVKLESGYYNVDASREDTRHTSSSYFNRTDEDLRGSHKRSGYSTLLPKCRATKYSGWK